MNALIQKAIEIEPGAKSQALVSIRELRQAVPMSKDDFDSEILSLAEGGKVWIHKHVDAGNMPQSEREELVYDGESFYMGLVLRDDTTSPPPSPQTKFADMDDENIRLSLENSQLRDEHNRDKETITRLQGELDDVKQGDLMPDALSMSIVDWQEECRILTDKLFRLERTAGTLEDKNNYLREENARLESELATFTATKELICEFCGEPFSILKSKRAKKYCSNACKQGHYREEKEWNDLNESVRVTFNR